MPDQRRVAGRYRLVQVIGRGASGVVWRAVDESLDRPVAVKEIPTRGGMHSQEPHEIQARLLREARASAKISHPGATQVYDVLSSGEVLYLVMELLDGASLDDVVKRQGPMDPRVAASIGADVAGALAAAHAAGVIHRDVKPANVLLLADNRGKLTDFGLAALAGDTRLTATGIVLGSPAYMAPEQARGSRPGPAADVWGLGATLYFLLEGSPPFNRGAPLPTLTAVLEDPVPVSSRAGPLEPVMTLLLNKNPGIRPDAASVADWLQQVGAGEPVAEAPPPAPRADTPLQTRTAAPSRAPSRPQPAEGRPSAVPAPEGGRPAPGASAGSRRRSPRVGVRPQPEQIRLIAIGVAALFAVVALVAIIAVGGQALEILGTDEQAGPTAGLPAEDGGEGSQPAPSAPQGWPVVGFGPTPASVAHPPGWEATRRDGTITDWHDPDRNRFLRTDWTDEPGGDPVAAWQRLSEQLAGSREGYQEVRIEATEVAGLPAALWEYRYRRGGVEMRSYNLGIVGEGYAYALNVHAADEAWADTLPLWEQIVASFSPR